MRGVRKLIVAEFLSLDGVMQGPGAPDEDTEGGFRHGGWSMPFGDDVFLENAQKGMAATDTYLFGRKTYEIMAAFWPTAPKDDPFAEHLNTTAKFVASTTLEDAKWQNSTLIKGDVVREITELKEQPGKDITVLGSGGLVQTLIKNDLVDEFSLTVYPIVLGEGKKLFRDVDDVKRLNLVDSKTTTTGGLILTYQLAREKQ